MYTIIQSLHQNEVFQQENLIALLGAVKGSKVSGPESQVPSLVRGLCTSNQKLLQSSSQCLAELASGDEQMEVFKVFVNEFIMWFDVNFVVFEKLHVCLSVEHITEGKIYQNPILHCETYVAFSVAASAVLRNPFVIEKLDEFKTRCEALIARNENVIKQAQLNDISFDHVQTFGGRSVSCFFTPEQIVKRTENTPLFMGQWKVEMLLLNLSQRPLSEFDSLAILRVPSTSEKRSVIYPPFRVNELSVSFSHNCINFSSLSLDLNAGKNFFAVTGAESDIEPWFHDLKEIFPTDEKLLHSSTVQLFGLGIETVLDSNDDASQKLACTSQDSTALPSRRSLDSCHSFEIMRKTLSSSGIEAEDKEKLLHVVEVQNQHHSITAEYAYPDELDVEVSSLIDSIDCFDMVTSVPHKQGIHFDKEATASLPNLPASAGASSVYINAAGSAIDVNNFGKSYNPSFASLPPAEEKTIAKKKSFLNLFRKKRKNQAKANGDLVHEETAEGSTQEEPKAKNPQTQNSTESVKSSADSAINSSATTTISSDQMDGSSLEKLPVTSSSKRHPDLQIEIPKIGALDANSSQPGSAISTSNRTLPLPFALPSSTSQYFFKPYMNGAGSTTDVNESATSVTGGSEEKEYVIPQEFKDIVNADDTLDFYITPIVPNSIKVSKWKHHCAKWELLTSNENVFLKIVANYNIYKSWLLVFKEEYDEEYGEIIDKPLMVLDLDDTTSARQSNALDVEIHGVDSFSKKKNHIIVRCYNGNLVRSLSTNLSNILEVMDSKQSLKQSSSFESSATISSSLMSKPSASSTLTSIYTQLDQKQTPSSSLRNLESNQELATGDKLLLDRMTIKLHKQMESYEQVHKASSWKSLAMYSLGILHSIGSSQEGFYHFDMRIKEHNTGDKEEKFLWTFKDDEIHGHIERIGKAAMLVKVSDAEIFMLECRGKKELKQLVNHF